MAWARLDLLEAAAITVSLSERHCATVQAAQIEAGSIIRTQTLGLSRILLEQSFRGFAQGTTLRTRTQAQQPTAIATTSRGMGEVLDAANTHPQQ